MQKDKFIFPKVLNIELTNACNLRCTMCPRTKNMTRPIGMMDLSLFKKIVDEAVENEVKQIELHAFGESMLYPQFFEAIAYVKSKKSKIKVGFSTNCTLLSEENNNKLLTADLDYIILSFDGATKQTYEKIRVGSKFEDVIEGIKSLLSLKKSRKLSNPLISIQIIYLQETKDEIESFFEMWKPYLSPHVHISVKEFVDYAGQVKSSVKKGEKVDFNRMPCGHFWTTATIYWDGTVTICCLDVNGDLKIGALNGQCLREVWNGETLKKMRQAILAKTYEGVEFCRKCQSFGRLIAQYPPNR